MKSIHTQSLTRKIILICGSAMVLFYISSCAQKITFSNSSVVPAARGSVKVKKDNNANYNIAISLSNLAEPGRLTPSKKTYVVWMETNDNVTKNIGQINTSTGFLSSKLKSSFETVSSNKPTKIFLTAEDDGGVQYPGATLILTTSSF